VKYRLVELDNTLLTKGPYPPDLFCMIEGTNTVLIVIKQTGTIFTLNLKSKQLRKIGERQTYFYFFGPILPYMSFYTPNC
jgi:hypothetical protein